MFLIVPLTEEGDVAYIVESEESDMEEEEEEEELDPDAIVSIDDQGDYSHNQHICYPLLT